MTSDGLHPPDLVLVVEGYAVGLVRAVLFQEHAEADDALARGLDVGQHEHEDILLPYAAGDFLFLFGLGLFKGHERVGRKHAWVGGDGLGGRHAHVCGVDARSGPDTVLGIDARAGGEAHRLLRQFDLNVGEHRLVLAFYVLRLENDELLGVEAPVVRTGDHRGTVVGGLFADQKRCAGHDILLFRAERGDRSVMLGGRQEFGPFPARILYIKKAARSKTERRFFNYVPTLRAGAFTPAGRLSHSIRRYAYARGILCAPFRPSGPCRIFA